MTIKLANQFRFERQILFQTWYNYTQRVLFGKKNRKRWVSNYNCWFSKPCSKP